MRTMTDIEAIKWFEVCRKNHTGYIAEIYEQALSALQERESLRRGCLGCKYNDGRSQNSCPCCDCSRIETDYYEAKVKN